MGDVMLNAGSRAFRISARIFLIMVFIALGHLDARAISLQISPVSIEILDPSSTATLTLKVEGKELTRVQIRVFRWTQEEGKDVLVNTTDAVASPPFITLKPNTNYTVRIVRQLTQPITSEETYRVVIDQLPNQMAAADGVVGMTMRFSIPAFVRPNHPIRSNVVWTSTVTNQHISLTATNKGDRTAKISDLKITLGKETLAMGDSLAGYIMPSKSKTWISSTPVQIAGGTVKVNAQGEMGPINVDIPLR